MPEDLSTVTTDELVDELRKRNDRTLIVLLMDRTSDQDQYTQYYSGGCIGAIGLATRAIHLLQLELDNV